VYGGIERSEARELKQLRGENGKLKQIVVNLSLGKVKLQDVLQTVFQYAAASLSSH
jgi:putative transposase